MTLTAGNRTGTADRPGADDATIASLDAYRGELRGYCYRMLGSVFDADDAVQETMVKAWQAYGRFEGRSSLRSWLYRIATNVCLDSLRSRERRAMPMDLSQPVPASTEPVATLPDSAWIEPAPDGELGPVDAMRLDADPAQRAVFSDTVRLAFVAALQALPARQRAVLILREVLCWQASEVAELLGTTVASVNSALQRARAGLAASAPSADDRPAALGAEQEALLARYVSAFEAYDIEALVSLLHEDASISMPPFELWLRGRDDVAAWFLGHGVGCKGSRLVPLPATNGCPAFAQYRVDPAGGWQPWAIQVVEIGGGRVQHVHHFLDTALFARFGLPSRLN